MSLIPSTKINTVPKYSEKYKDILKKIVEQERSSKLVYEPKMFFFRIKSIGVGAHSVVYLVQDDATKSVYAQKCISKQHALQIKEDLINEIKLHLQLHHPNIIKLYHIYFDQVNLYLIMEVGFQSLFAYLSRKKQLQERDAISITKDILTGVKHLHDREIVHADLKLENVILNNGEAKICDFGYAHQFGRPINQQLIGTMEYLAPQFMDKIYIKQKLNHASQCWKRDIWAVGMICYQMLTSQHLMNKLGENQKWTYLMKFESLDLSAVKASEQMKQFLNFTLCKVQNRKSAAQLLKLALFREERQEIVK